MTSTSTCVLNQLPIVCLFDKARKKSSKKKCNEKAKKNGGRRRMMLRENKKRINYFFDWKSNKKYFNNNSIRRITSKLNARIFSKFYVTLSYFLLWISASDTQKLFVSHGNEIDVREEKTKTVFRFLGILTIYKLWASIYLAQTHIVVFLRSAFYVFVRVLWICELRANKFLFFFD